MSKPPVADSNAWPPFRPPARRAYAEPAASPPELPPSNPRPYRQWPARLLVSVLILVGTLITAWPIFDTYANNERGLSEVTEYLQKQQKIPPQILNSELEAARRYNEALPPERILDPWQVDAGKPGAAHAAYLNELNAQRVMARIRIPAMVADLPILHDANASSLANGVGHLYGSSLPVGGPDTHAVLAGHAGMSNRTMFDRLGDLKVGDRFYLDVAGQTLTYRVDKISLVLPSQLDAVQRIPGGDYVTLVTCTPRPSWTHRLLVRGVRELGEAATAEAEAELKQSPVVDLSVQEWMWPRIAISATALAIWLVMIALWFRDHRRGAQANKRDNPIVEETRRRANE